MLPLFLPPNFKEKDFWGDVVSPLSTPSGYGLVKLGDPLGNLCHVVLLRIRNHGCRTCPSVRVSGNSGAEHLDSDRQPSP